jgi:WD40 repeat protein
MRLLRIFARHESGVYGVAFSPNGQMALSGAANFATPIGVLLGKEHQEGIAL